MDKIAKIDRKKTREVKVGDLIIGGNNPVVVQEMTSTDTKEIDKTVTQIHTLEENGCRLIRLAIPDTASALAIKHIKGQVSIPLIADIHFNYRLALLAIENGAHKIRINPGNIGSVKKISRVVSAAKERGIPIRIGVNSGSLEKAIVRKYSGKKAQGMVESALNEVSLLERHNFYDIVISLKSSDIDLTVESNKTLSSKVDYPLHIGITEAGFGRHGIIRAITGVSTLLLNGIGDTIRISLMDTSRIENIRICYKMLEELNIPFI